MLRVGGKPSGRACRSARSLALRHTEIYDTTKSCSRFVETVLSRNRGIEGLVATAAPPRPFRNARSSSLKERIELSRDTDRKLAGAEGNLLPLSPHDI